MPKRCDLAKSVFLFMPLDLFSNTAIAKLTFFGFQISLASLDPKL
jgi:hypothetical protein